jgi:hypothetical protein
MNTAIIARDTVETLCEKRDRALQLFEEAAAKLKEAHAVLDSVTKHAGPDSNVYRDLSYSTDGFVKACQKKIDERFWLHIMDTTQLVTLMDSQAKDEFRKSMEKDVPALTVDNVCGTVSAFVGNSENIFNRGVVNAFRQLDFKYKTNNAFRLDKKVILRNALTTGWGFHFNSYMRTDERLRDVERVFCVFDGKPTFPHGGGVVGAIYTAMHEKRRDGESEYFRFKMHKNGTLHIWFKNMKLVNKCNRIIADHYGATLAHAA